MPKPEVVDAEVGHVIFLSEGASKRVFAFLNALGYPPTDDGMAKFLVDSATGRGTSKRTANAIREALTSEDMIKLAKHYAPTALRFLKKVNVL